MEGGEAPAAFKEHCKIAVALLFDVPCEYPRKIDSGEYANRAASIAAEAALDAAFLYKSNTDAQFARSIRFRKWIRYGVEVGFLADQVGVDNAAVARIAFPNPADLEMPMPLALAVKTPVAAPPPCRTHIAVEQNHAICQRGPCQKDGKSC